jgi:hypothetical protein
MRLGDVGNSVPGRKFQYRVVAPLEFRGGQRLPVSTEGRDRTYFGSKLLAGMQDRGSPHEVRRRARRATASPPHGAELDRPLLKQRSRETGRGDRCLYSGGLRRDRWKLDSRELRRALRGLGLYRRELSGRILCGGETRH